MPSIRKLYYSIREVWEQTGLKPHVLRYWEGEFDALSPRKNRAGNRTYTARDLDVLLRIQRLLRDEKYTIEGARRPSPASSRRPTAAPAAPPDARPNSSACAPFSPTFSTASTDALARRPRPCTPVCSLSGTTSSPATGSSPP